MLAAPSLKQLRITIIIHHQTETIGMSGLRRILIFVKLISGIITETEILVYGTIPVVLAVPVGK